MKALDLLKNIDRRCCTDRVNGLLDLAIKELKELENRSCGNCKYNYYDKEDAILMCTNEDNNQEYLHNSKMQITLDFYCNKWENKAQITNI